jgi:hypothetical protein
MFALLASFLMLAAGEPVAPPPLPDTEVITHLNSHEKNEWFFAKKKADEGMVLIKRARSILASRGISDDFLDRSKAEEMFDPSAVRMPVSNLGSMGGGAAGFASPKANGTDAFSVSETPEQTKTRAQKFFEEGSAKIQQVFPTLSRLRLAAAQRVAEKMKPVDFAVEITAAAPPAALDAAVGRLHKQAVDLGYASAHLIGSLRVSSAGLERPAELTADLRAAWSRRTGAALAAAPAEGYAYVPAVAPAAPALSKGLKPATAPKQLAVLWAEQYAVGADGAQTLLFLRLADAHSFRIIASELVLTHTGATPVVGTVVLRDERSFIPRLTQSGEWAFGFERDSHPVGSALLTHLCLTQTKLSVAGDPYVAIVAGGGPAGGVVGAKWRATAVEAPATSPASPTVAVTAFTVQGIPAGGAAVAVGPLTLRVGAPGVK